MANKNLLASSSSKEKLQNIINKYFYSENIIITDDNRIFNKKLNKYLDDFKVVSTKSKWRFELA